MKLKLNFVCIGLLSLTISESDSFAQSKTSCFDLDEHEKISSASFLKTSNLFKKVAFDNGVTFNKDNYTKRMKDCFFSDPLAFSRILEDPNVKADIVSTVSAAELFQILESRKNELKATQSGRDDFLRFAELIFKSTFPPKATIDLPLEGLAEEIVPVASSTGNEIYRLREILSKFKTDADTSVNQVAYDAGGFRVQLRGLDGDLARAKWELATAQPIVNRRERLAASFWYHRKFEDGRGITQEMRDAVTAISRPISETDSPKQSIRYAESNIEYVNQRLNEATALYAHLKKRQEEIVSAIEKINTSCEKRICSDTPNAAEFRNELYRLVNSTNSALRVNGIGAGAITNASPSNSLSTTSQEPVKLIKD